MKVSVHDIVHRGDPVAAPASAEPAEKEAGMTCIACGDRLPPVLEELGSLRCHDCRDGEPASDEVL